MTSKPDSLAPSPVSPGASQSYASQLQTVPIRAEMDDPPPYEPPTTTTATMTDIPLEHTGPPAPAPGTSRLSTSSLANRCVSASTSLASGYQSGKPMTATLQEPPTRADHTGQPGCCCSDTGGCIGSSNGGCFFSDNEGCCFSDHGGCCFSDNAGCCFSDNGGCCFSDNGGGNWNRGGKKPSGGCSRNTRSTRCQG